MTAAAPRFEDQFRGILAMTAACFFFGLVDTQTKVVAARLPVGETIALRGLFATVVIGVIVVALGHHRQMGFVTHPTLIQRALAEMIASALFVIALVHMTLASITAVVQVLPLALTAAGAVFLGERVGWRRWAAILIGFAGVMVVLRPGFGDFNPYGLLALACVAIVCVRDLATRRMPRGVPTLLVAAMACPAIMIAGLILGVAEVWLMPTWTEVALCAGAGSLMALGSVLVITAVRHGDMSVVAPFRYSSIVWAILLGYLVWGDIPDLATLAGSAIIVATGIYTFQRERFLARTSAPPLDL